MFGFCFCDHTSSRVLQGVGGKAKTSSNFPESPIATVPLFADSIICWRVDLPFGNLTWQQKVLI